MSSLKDKLKSKIKSKIEQAQTMQSFDESSVVITLSDTKTQLAQLRLQFQWANKNSMKAPKLRCRWYNRTENNLQQIVGVQEQFYQPSIYDVGSIIEVTCVPQLPGVSYEGMPIQLKSNPIPLAMQTENEAAHFLEQQKAKFFVQIKEARTKVKNVTHNSDGFIKIEGVKLTFCLMKFGQLNDDVLKQMTIDEAFPQYILNRRNGREIVIRFSEEQSCLIHFKSHQVRDVFCLLNKLMVAKTNLQKMQRASLIRLQERSNNISNQTIKQAKQQQNETVNAQRQIPKQQSLKHQASTQSSLKQVQKQQVVKHTAQQLLQIGTLMQQIKQLQTSNSKIQKQLQSQRQKVFNLQNKLSQTSERLQSASRNYFSLENDLQNYKKQIKKYKQDIDKKSNEENNKDEEMIYYRNQVKLLSSQRDKISETLETYKRQNQKCVEQLNKYKEVFQTNQTSQSINQLAQEISNLRSLNSQLKLKYQYSLQEKQKIEQNLKNSRNFIEQIQAQKKYIQKKYESLSCELSSPNLSHSKLSQSRSNGESSLSSSLVFEEIPSMSKNQSSTSSYAIQFEGRQKQILDLKRQVRDLMEQNEYIRGLLSKQKKNSSKTQLKLQLFQVKKLVNRLSQAVVEKDMCIGNLKQINKELNKKNKQLQQVQGHIRKSA